MNSDFSLFAQLDHRHGFLRVHFRSGIDQRRAAVAHGSVRPPDVLRTMQMPQRHIIKRVVQRRINIFKRARYSCVPNRWSFRR